MLPKPPTIHQRKVCKTYIDSKNPTDAGRKLNPNRSMSAMNLGVNRVLANPNVKYHLSKMMDECGISDSKICEILKEALEAKRTHFFSKDGEVTDERTVPDHTTRINAVDRVLELKGYTSKGGSTNNTLNVNIDNVELISNSELVGIIDVLRNELQEGMKDVELEV